MLLSRNRRRTTAAVLAAAVSTLAGIALVRAADPTGTKTDPTTVPPARDVKAIQADLRATSRKLSADAPAATLADPAKRTAAAPKVIPELTKMCDLFDEWGHAQPQIMPALPAQKEQFQAMLYLFGDKPTVARIDAAGADDLTAQATKLHAKLLGSTPAEQPAVADQIKKLDAAHPDSDELTRTTYMIGRSASNKKVGRSLMAAAADMNNPMATQLKAMEQQQQAMDAAAAKQKDMVGKPLTITGTTPDGKPFSSDDYKGKVVLVDFWASWCGPCKAELPRVKDLYAKYHDKGLEVIGVDNDFTAAAVTGYTSKNNMPWVELYDAADAAKHGWNAITTGYGINGIPVMFLIDKKGVLRTVEARQSMEEEIPKLLAE